jgi:hypothetical protein
MFSPIVLVAFGKHYSYGFPLSWSCELALVIRGGCLMGLLNLLFDGGFVIGIIFIAI